MTYSITNEEFRRYQTLVYQQTGISLSDQKQSLVVARLSKRLRELSLPSFQAYFDYVVNDKDQDELTRLLDLISTNKTEFFREPGHFQFLKEQILPHLQDSRHVRIWSAACSSGEEPYTIAMTLYDAVPHPARWNFKILASDISTRMLAKAAKGIYEEEMVAHLPKAVLHRHFLRGKGDNLGRFKIKPHLSGMVVHRRINLMEDSYPIRTPLDAIFCRNVLIYFDRPTQTQLVAKFNRYLKPGGYLFIGHSESLQWIEHPFTYVAPTIYQKPGREVRSEE